ncbi:hypothetical protein NC651_036082 [Populus alba x Populus x berolinensis]|nr:hypothetical protein NC651_036082 [Populus alba x Populus x berolinensis]
MKLPWSFIRSPCSIFRKPYVTRLSHRRAKVTIEGTTGQKREMGWNSINIVGALTIRPQFQECFEVLAQDIRTTYLFLRGDLDTLINGSY